LYHYALYLVKNDQAAQDLCQETFIRWFNLPDPGNIETPQAWLKRVVSNLAFNHLRHQKVRFKLEADSSDNSLAQSVNVDQDLNRLEVEDVLNTLPVKERMLLKMKMAGLSYGEMAEALGVAKGSIGVMLMRALTKFKQSYEGNEGKGVSQKHELSERRPTVVIYRGAADR
jgi:RNA polymerase sigma-70 factor (ECF subfamily)